MLVEDNDVFREALELMLGMRDGIEVVAAVGDGGAAVDAALASNPDVALVDYRLPGLDGIQVTTELLAKVPGIAVVALTASANEAQRKALLDAGAFACLGKEQELDEIVAAIRAAAAPA